jgi:cyclohexanecarboxyl-CoA dehydrogenase
LPFEQRLRDVMGLELGDGTAQIMKVIVARELMGCESLPYWSHAVPNPDR